MDWYDFKVRRQVVVRWISVHKPVVNLPRISIASWLLIVQLLGCAAVLYGIAIYSHPIAFIIGGLTAIIAVERQSHEPRLSAEETVNIQRKIKLALAASKDPFEDPDVPLTPAWVTYAASLRKMVQ